MARKVIKSVSITSKARENINDNFTELYANPGSTTTSSAAELNFNDGAIAGTAVASKTVVLDASKNHTGISNLTLGVIGASGVVGKVILSDGANPGYKASVYTDAQTADINIHIPDPGNIVDAYVPLSTAALTAAEVDVLDGATAGTVVASKTVVVDASKNIGRFETITSDALDLSSGTPVSHPINMESLTLADNTNAIRGASVNPTRTSGWISFSGTIANAPAAVYTDYRELHTTGTGEVLGIGSFPYMDATSSCQSMFAGQDIAYVSAGATVESAAGAPGIGIFGRFIKTVLDGETFTSGGVAAAMFLSVQANVTDVQAEDTSIFNTEVASGGIQNILKFQCSAAKGATYLFNFTDDNGEPVSLTNGTDLADISATANAGWIKVLVGSTVRYIPLYAVKAS